MCRKLETYESCSESWLFSWMLLNSRKSTEESGQFSVRLRNFKCCPQLYPAQSRMATSTTGTSNEQRNKRKNMEIFWIDWHQKQKCQNYQSRCRFTQHKMQLEIQIERLTPLQADSWVIIEVLNRFLYSRPLNLRPGMVFKPNQNPALEPGFSDNSKPPIASGTIKTDGTCRTCPSNNPTQTAICPENEIIQGVVMHEVFSGSTIEGEDEMFQFSNDPPTGNHKCNQKTERCQFNSATILHSGKLEKSQLKIERALVLNKTIVIISLRTLVEARRLDRMRRFRRSPRGTHNSVVYGQRTVISQWCIQDSHILARNQHSFASLDDTGHNAIEKAFWQL